MQGDIVRIFNNSGALVASYVYDAWGNHKVYDASGVENTSVTFIGNINPFRYRGYYYDAETGLYYLNSRYYDPEIKRFINSDDIRVISETGLNVNGQNLFVYCNNNPVMLKDPSGQIAITTILLGLFLGLTLALSIYGVICAYNEYMRHPTTANLIALILEGVFLILDIVSIIATVVTVVKAAKALSAIDVSGISKMPASDFGGDIAKAGNVTQSADAFAAYKLDPRSIELAKQGNPSWGTFKKRVWKYEAQFRPDLYKNDLERMFKGLAPKVNNKSMHLHHIKGKAIDMYDVIKVTQTDHIAIHKALGYHQSELWCWEELSKILKNL